MTDTLTAKRDRHGYYVDTRAALPSGTKYLTQDASGLILAWRTTPEEGDYGWLHPGRGTAPYRLMVVAHGRPNPNWRQSLTRVTRRQRGGDS